MWAVVEFLGALIVCNDPLEGEYANYYAKNLLTLIDRYFVSLGFTQWRGWEIIPQFWEREDAPSE
jgi:hypothetical protein